MVYLVWSATFWVAALTTTTTLTDAWAPPPRLIQSSCTFSKPLSSTQKKSSTSSTSRLFLASWKEHDPYVNIGNHERITPSYNNYNHVSWGEEDEHRHHPNNHDAREGRSVNFQNNVNHEIHHNVHSFQPDNWHVNSYNNNNGNNNGNHQRNNLSMHKNNNVSINRSTLAQRSGGINNGNHHDRYRRNPNSQFVGWDGRPDDGYLHHHGPEHRGYAAVDDRWDDEEHDHYPRRRHGGRDHHHRPKQYAGTLHRNSKDGTRMVGEDGFYSREEDDRDYHHRDDYEYDYHDDDFDYHTGLDYRRNSNSRLAPYYQERGHHLEARHRRRRNYDDDHDDYHYYGDDEEDYYDHDDFDHHYSGGRRRHRDRGLVMEVMDDTYQALDDLWHDTNHVLNRMSDMVRTTMKRGKNHHRGSMMRLNNRRRRRANRHLFVDPRHFADFAPTRHGRSSPVVRHHHHDEEDIASLLHEAEDFMNHDPACTNVLGDDIHAGRIHSQSASASSSSSTRGHRHRHDDDDRMETKLEFAVRGSYEAGTAQLWASEWGVEEILVRVPEERGYREIVVDLMSTSGHHHRRRRRHHRHHHEEADVVDAEII